MIRLNIANIIVKLNDKNKNVVVHPSTGLLSDKYIIKAYIPVTTAIKALNKDNYSVKFEEAS